MENLRYEELIGAESAFAAVELDAPQRLVEPGAKVAVWRSQPAIAGLERAVVSRLYPALIVLVGAALLGLMVIPNNVVPDTLSEGQALLLAVSVIGLIGGLLELWRSTQRPGSDDEVTPNEYEVVLVLSRDRLPYAADKGMVTFSDGYFFFESAATMFSFSRPAIRPPKPRPVFSLWEGSCRLMFGNDGIERELSMSSYHSRLFQRSFNGWMNSAVKAVEEVLPPTRANASGLRLARLEALLILSNFGLVTASLAIWAKMLSHPDPYTALVPIIVDPAHALVLWLAVAIPTLVFAVAIPLIRACMWIGVLKRELKERLVGVVSTDL